jgi:hypothetical protein
MIFNLVHRADNAPVYDWQRGVGHELGFRITVFLSSNHYGNEKIVRSCIEDREKYDDEIGIWLTPDDKAGGPVT